MTEYVDNFTPLPALLTAARDAMLEQLHARLQEDGYDDIRPGHGCVFRFVGPEGMRVTELAEAAEMTKQACSEIVSDLEQLGYVERVADSADGRAKIIRMTAKGREAQRHGKRVFEQLEAEWAERYGAERMRVLRELLEEAAGSPVPA